MNEELLKAEDKLADMKIRGRELEAENLRLREQIEDDLSKYHRQENDEHDTTKDVFDVASNVHHSFIN